MKTILKRLDYLLMTDNLDMLHKTIISMARANQQGIVTDQEYDSIRDYISSIGGL